MLTAQQIEVHETSLGASEIAAALGLDPRVSPIDVWLRKRTPGRAPIVPTTTLPDPDKPGATMGAFVEPMLAEYYATHDQVRVERPQRSFRHPAHSWLSASPDLLVFGKPPQFKHRVASMCDYLAEIKAVGPWQRQFWAEEQIPETALIQVTIQCAVMSMTRVDIIAGLGLTEAPAIYRCTYDPELGDVLIAQALEWWHTYIDNNEPPPVGPKESLASWVSKRFQRVTRAELLQISAEDQAVLQAVADYRVSKAGLVIATEDCEADAARVKQIIGEHPGIAGPFGEIRWREQRGRVDTAAVLDALGGATDELKEKYRGHGWRVLNDTTAEELEERALKKAAKAVH